ncbi:hypothetical protein CEXT_239701 [Caerostris extrusa]|uniref:Uncharacterized protein n=1 Tax=Caerostris extrusa TaxID=172846 RepID=A0AAV4U5F4_CAEEX|nr:hypothetical protein CEXT_239701 [Caerostris extrusa]
MPRLSFSFRGKAFYQASACFFPFNFLASSQTTVPQSLGESRRDILHNGDKFPEALAIVTEGRTPFGTGDITDESTPLGMGT